MAKVNFDNLDKKDQEAIFTNIALEKGMTAFAVDKDWWVSRTLEMIFQMPIAIHLVLEVIFQELYFGKLSALKNQEL